MLIITANESDLLILSLTIGGSILTYVQMKLAKRLVGNKTHRLVQHKCVCLHVYVYL